VDERINNNNNNNNMLSGYNEYCSNGRYKEIHHTQVANKQDVWLHFFVFIPTCMLFTFLLALCLKASTEPTCLLAVANIGIL
jgi:hypothetical protein